VIHFLNVIHVKLKCGIKKEGKRQDIVQTQTSNFVAKMGKSTSFEVATSMFETAAI
jgi:hypothetical protein